MDHSLPALIVSLQREARDFPHDRKLLVASSFGEGRELLRALARLGTGWIGFEVLTPRPLAMHVAAPEMSRRGVQAMDPFEEQALLDEAMDGVFHGARAGRLGEMAEGVGFREGVHGAIRALRLADIGVDQLRSAPLREKRKRDVLARTLKGYERLLATRQRTDAAGVLALAVELLAAGEGRPPPGRVLLLPGLTRRGLAGRLTTLLQERGAVTLQTDPVVGVDPPPWLVWHSGEPQSTLSFLNRPPDAEAGAATRGQEPSAAAPLARAPSAAPEGSPGSGVPTVIELFRAASMADELKEVLRRVRADGLAWDEVEIVTPDPAAYGSAMHSLAARLEIPVTFGVGLPVERTRPGRAMAAYFHWIEGGFQALEILHLLEAGDLRPPRSKGFVSPGELARRFRSLRIGWGRERYVSTLGEAVDAVARSAPRRHQTEEQHEARKERDTRALEALRSILAPVLRATPSVPDRLGQGGVPVSPAELAAGLRTFLGRVPGGSGPDATAREQLMRVVDRVEATLVRKTDFRAAVVILRRHLAIRVRAPALAAGQPADGGSPWRSEGGHLHLTDLAHGGLCGRRATFVVGLDAGRFPGAGLQDPVLLDADRRRLEPDALPTSSDRMREGSFRLAALLARLRGRVTLSYGAWEAAEARSVAPATVLLQALRVDRRDPMLTFEALHDHLGSARGPIPGTDVVLDREDVWMRALGAGSTLLGGSAAVREGFPRLDAGLLAQEALAGAPSAHHGLVIPRPDELDPRLNEDIHLSASRLEGLGSCPLKYFYAAVLKLYPPEDPILEPDAWLDSAARGSLLHSVYEGTLRLARERDVAFEEVGFEELALQVLHGEVEGMVKELPSPGDGVLRREIVALEEDVRSFVRLIREEGAPWIGLEYRFGLQGGEPFVLDLDGGKIRLRGAVDRIDDTGTGLRIVDYKTGTSSYHKRGTVFKGGRRLQHAVYSWAVARSFEGDVEVMEYRFPTLKGENDRKVFTPTDLTSAAGLLNRMLDGVAEGKFVPTDDPNDCRFCDYRAVCRVRRTAWNEDEAPLAEWANERSILEPAFDVLREVRAWEG